MRSVENRLFLTGGSRGLGWEIGNTFGQKGWDVVAPTRKELDLSKQDSIKSYLETEMRKIGPTLNAFVHSAGINPSVAMISASNEGPHFDLDAAMSEFDHVVQVNARSFLHLGRGMLHIKQESGGPLNSIVGVSSIFGGDITKADKLPYSASKAMLEKMVQQLAVEWGPLGVRVNGIEPGFFPTEMTVNNLVSRYGPEITSTIESQTPLGRFGKPPEIGSVAFFLCTGPSSFMTGQMLRVDGGYTAGGGIGVWDRLTPHQ